MKLNGMHLNTSHGITREKNKYKESKKNNKSLHYYYIIFYVKVQ